MEAGKEKAALMHQGAARTILVVIEWVDEKTMCIVKYARIGNRYCYKYASM